MRASPIHTDAEVEIRPRLFLEGNFFVDLSPGSPSAPELASGEDIPITQTATAVQLDEVLTALQAPQRRGLQRLLEGYGTALTYEPTAIGRRRPGPLGARRDRGRIAQRRFPLRRRRRARDGDRQHGAAGREPATTSPDSSAASARRSASSPPGRRAPDLITNFNVFTGALAAESANLSRTVEELAPTLEEARPSLAALNDALPAVRTLAIESQPAIEELPATIAAGDPWLRQARKLVGDRELGGLARLLRDAAPGLAQATNASIDFFRQQTLLAQCTSRVLVPTGDVVVNDGFSTGQPNFNEFLYSVVNLNGIVQGFDGNGPYARFQSGGGPTLVRGAVPRGHCGQRDQLLEPDRGPRRPPARGPGLAAAVPAGRPLQGERGPRHQRTGRAPSGPSDLTAIP